jgi:hypothetical protein
MNPVELLIFAASVQAMTSKERPRSTLPEDVSVALSFACAYGIQMLEIKHVRFRTGLTGRTTIDFGEKAN